MRLPEWLFLFPQRHLQIFATEIRQPDTSIFSPLLGEMIQFDLRIFFKWVETQPPTTACKSLHISDVSRVTFAFCSEIFAKVCPSFGAIFSFAAAQGKGRSSKCPKVTCAIRENPSVLMGL